jgi:hypothetical protein
MAHLAIPPATLKAICPGPATSCLIDTPAKSVSPVTKEAAMPPLLAARTAIRKDTLPAHSHLWSRHAPGDFLDCYSVASALTPQEAATQGLALPAWARGLLGLRNRLMRPFGLKTGSDGAPLFPTCVDTEDELVIGTDDRHLDFRIAVLRQDGRIYMSTWVHPHNRWGRAYLALVMPFHVLISRGAVARMAA